MEKFSAYRDPGTGIQPFLRPVPPLEVDLFVKISLPLRLALGVIRTALVLLIGLAYIILDKCLLVFYPIYPLYALLEHSVKFILGRIALFVLGIFWIHVEQFNRKRSRAPKLPESWNPRPGDIIVSNWSSWVEAIWLALRYNPVFVLPVPVSHSESPVPGTASTPITHKPGRRTDTGSANVQLPSRASLSRVQFRGFQKVSLLKLISLTGHAPPFDVSGSCMSLEEIQQNAGGPIVVFPECTTSNGRGLLRFASVFRKNVPVKKYQVFIMNIRCDPPSSLAHTLTHSMPSRFINPLPELFAIAMSLAPTQMTIRLLAPSESPGSQLFIASEILSDYSGDDQLSEACAILIASMGKMKRTAMGWEDKCNFLEFYESKRNG
ncbi:hypothetical protein CPB83DRAFT_842996 [Crepidotus variabilis]|uniref:Uncharacterized protein n=1 Tax=Crepidotus variabilis TaxID=179855 RepID=A0A9P6EUB2_9AGAR|nr:hypothetical protein CPB83DRAFT_842996 [Crepidotus variabilis]